MEGMASNDWKTSSEQFQKSGSLSFKCSENILCEMSGLRDDSSRVLADSLYLYQTELSLL